MSFINLSILLSLAVIGIISLSKILTEKKHLFYSTSILLAIAILTYSSSLPALATTNLAVLDANESTLSQEQQQIEEDLKVTPGGGHYSGIEHANRVDGREKPVSDRSIEKTIEQYSSDNLTVAVANGSVKLSGRVKDKEVAQHIVNQVKEIPGVYEVTYNLGLENNAI